MYSGVSFAALAKLFVCNHARHATLHVAVSLSRFRCSCQRYENITAKRTFQQCSFVSLTTKALNAIVPGIKKLKIDKVEWKVVSNSFGEHVLNA